MCGDGPMSMEIAFMRGKQSTDFLNNYWLQLWLRRNTPVQDLNEDDGCIPVGLLAKLLQDIRSVLIGPMAASSLTQPHTSRCRRAF